MTDRRIPFVRVMIRFVVLLVIAGPGWAEQSEPLAVADSGPTETPTPQAISTSTPPSPSPSIGVPTPTPSPQAISTSPPSPSPSIGMPTVTPTATVLPQIMQGATAGSTLVTGQAAPNATPGNQCVCIVCCDPAGCGGPNDHVIGTGDVDAQGFFAVTVAPPLEAGKLIYARDDCTGQGSEPLLVGLGTVVPAASPLLVGMLAVVLASVAVWALRHRRA